MRNKTSISSLDVADHLLSHLKDKKIYFIEDLCDYTLSQLKKKGFLWNEREALVIALAKRGLLLKGEISKPHVGPFPEGKTPPESSPRGSSQNI